MWGWEGWYCVAVILIAFVALIKDWAPADFVMLMSLALVMAAQIVTTEEGLEGFANSGVLSVAVLYVVAAGISATGALDYLMNKVLGNPRNLIGAQLRMIFPVGLISAFMNNTPVVAVMIPIIQQWSRRTRVPPSQLFIPLSFASILGGTCTLIGTSTNLVVAGKAEERYGNSTGLFDITTVGVPVLFSGVTYIIIFSPFLLPGARELEKRARKSLGLDARTDSMDFVPPGIGTDFTVACIVGENSEVSGKAVEDAGLRGLHGLYLTSVQRGERLFNAVGPEFVVQMDDVLFFTGLVDTFPEFCLRHGFTPITDANDDRLAELSSPTSDVGRRKEEEKTMDNLNVSYVNKDDEKETEESAKSPRHRNLISRVIRAREDSEELLNPESVERIVVGAIRSGNGYHELEKGSASAKQLSDSATVQQDRNAFSDGNRPSENLQQNVLTRGRMRGGTFDGRITKAVVRSNEHGQLEGKTPKEVDFRSRYHAAILSIHRAGEKLGVRGGLGRIVLRVGDVLLLVLGDEFDWEAEETKRDLKPYVSLHQAYMQDHEENNGGGELRYASEHHVINLDGISNETEAIEREFLISMQVADASRFKGSRPLVGQTVEQAGLRGLPGLFLVAIERANGGVEHAVGPDAVLGLNDILWFVGERDAVSTLRRIPGLVSVDKDQLSKLKAGKLERRLVECVLSLRSDMIGKTVREARFRTRFDAAIIAVHRKGRRVLSKIGDIELLPGDVLILDTGPYFIPRFRDDPNFLLVAEIENSNPPRFDKFYIALAAIIGMMILFMASGSRLSLFECAVFAAAVMIASGIITAERARSAVAWDVIVTIACAFGLSNALENSRVASTVGQALVDLAELTGTGEIGILTAIYLATFLISLVVANNAAAVLMFPIAAEAADSLGINTDRMIFTLMLAASSSFSSPFGYQTNLMVYGPGNYVFMDFVRFGFPMQIWQMVFSVIIVYFNDFWYISLGISVAIFFVVLFALSNSCRRNSSQPSRSHVPGSSTKSHGGAKPIDGDEPIGEDDPINNISTSATRAVESV